MLEQQSALQKVAMFGNKALLAAYDELCKREWKYARDEMYDDITPMSEWAQAVHRVLEMRGMIWFEKDGVEYRRTHKGLEVVPKQPFSRW